MDSVNQDILIKNEEGSDQSEQNNTNKMAEETLKKEPASTWSMGRVNKDDPKGDNLGATTPLGVPTGLGATTPLGVPTGLGATTPLGVPTGLGATTPGGVPTGLGATTPLGVPTGLGATALGGVPGGLGPTSLGGIPTGLGATALGGIPTIQKKTEIKAEGDLQIVAKDGIVNLGDVVHGDYVSIANQQVFFVVQGDQQGKSSPEHEISKGYVDLPCPEDKQELFRRKKELFRSVTQWFETIYIENDTFIPLYSVPAEKYSDCCQLCEEISSHAMFYTWDVDKQKCFCGRPSRYLLNLYGWKTETNLSTKCCEYSFSHVYDILSWLNWSIVMFLLLFVPAGLGTLVWELIKLIFRCIIRWRMKKVGDRDLAKDSP